MSSWSRASSANSSARVDAAAPALLPHALADGAGNARLARRRRDDTALRLTSGDLQHHFGADRIAEFLALADRDDERTGTADDAVLVVNVEVVDIHARRARPFQHDRQAIDGDVLG